MPQNSTLRKLEQNEHVWNKIKQIIFNKRKWNRVLQALRKRTYGVVGDHIIRARKINLLVKILEILSTLQQDNTSRIGHSFEIALLDTVTFHFDRSNVFIDKGEKMSYLNGTSKEKFIVPDTEDDILMGTDAGFIDVDYPVSCGSFLWSHR